MPKEHPQQGQITEQLDPKNKAQAQKDANLQAEVNMYQLRTEVGKHTSIINKIKGFFEKLFPRND